jgi:hypothetical protein
MHAIHGLMWPAAGQQSACAAASGWFAVRFPATFIPSRLLLLMLLIRRILSVLLEMGSSAS